MHGGFDRSINNTEISDTRFCGSVAHNIKPALNARFKLIVIKSNY